MTSYIPHYRNKLLHQPRECESCSRPSIDRRAETHNPVLQPAHERAGNTQLTAQRKR
jgi:hypothetical protein